MYSLPDGTFSSDEDEEEDDEDEEEDEEGEDNGLFLTLVPFSIILFLSGYYGRLLGPSNNTNIKPSRD